MTPAELMRRTAPPSKLMPEQQMRLVVISTVAFGIGIMMIGSGCILGMMKMGYL